MHRGFLCCCVVFSMTSATAEISTLVFEHSTNCEEKQCPSVLPRSVNSLHKFRVEFLDGIEPLFKGHLLIGTTEFVKKKSKVQRNRELNSKGHDQSAPRSFERRSSCFYCLGILFSDKTKMTNQFTRIDTLIFIEDTRIEDVL